MKRVIVISFIFLIAGIAVFAQDVREAKLRLGYVINGSAGTTELRMHLLIPSDIHGRQRVNSLTFSHPPDTVYSRNGNRYADFTFRGSIPESLYITLNLTLFRPDLYTLRANSEMRIFADSAELKRYLSPERYIECADTAIVNQAHRLQGQSRVQTLENIFKFVNGHIKYAKVGDGRPNGALSVLRSQKGVYSDFSYLMVALCRAASIAAKPIFGIITKYSVNPLHQWVEAYVDEIGWVAFEPTWAYSGFDMTDLKYIYMCQGQNFNYRQYKYKGAQPLITPEYRVQ